VYQSQQDVGRASAQYRATHTQAKEEVTVSEELIDISKQRFVQNGLDIEDEFGILGIPTEFVLSSALGFAMGCIVQYLNDTGHELAGQALDDAWHDREDQWWREPDGFDGRYKHGEELRNV
jgi:hypothetical protein